MQVCVLQVYYRCECIACVVQVCVMQECRAGVYCRCILQVCVVQMCSAGMYIACMCIEKISVVQDIVDYSEVIVKLWWSYSEVRVIINL